MRKALAKEVVLQAIQAALESATRKLTGKDIGVRVRLDPRTGEYETFRYWDVVADEEVRVSRQRVNIGSRQKNGYQQSK